MTTMDMDTVDLDDARTDSLPKTEVAIDNADRKLLELEGKFADADIAPDPDPEPDPDAWAIQEQYCLRTRTAEDRLKITWIDRGGRYPAASLDRFAKNLRRGIKVVRAWPSTDGRGHTHKDIANSLRDRLLWVEGLLPDKEASAVEE